MRQQLSGAVDFVSGFLEIRVLGFVDVNELLRIAVNHGKPGALDLNHDPVSLQESMAAVPEAELDLRGLPRHKRRRAGKTVSVSAPEDFPGQQHLEISHSYALGIWRVVGRIPSIFVDELDDPIRVRAGRRDKERGSNRTRDGYVFG